MYIDDLIYGLIKMMNTKDDQIGPINLGNPQEISIINLAKMILNITESKSKIVFKNLPKDDPKRRKPNILKANKILEWKPTFGLEVGLTKTINYFKTINETN